MSLCFSSSSTSSPFSLLGSPPGAFALLVASPALSAAVVDFTCASLSGLEAPLDVGTGAFVPEPSLITSSIVSSNFLFVLLNFGF